MTESKTPLAGSGDDGTTSLGGIDGVPKTLARVGACGDVEEANTALGAAIATDSMPEEFDVLLRNIQNDLLDVHADLSVPSSADSGDVIRVQRHYVERLDAACQQYSMELQQGSTVFGGFSDAAGLLRLARAITRRAERSTWALIASVPEDTATLPAVYLNRLSDLLLAVTSQVENEDAGKVPLGICGGPSVGTATAAASTTWSPGREWDTPRLA